MNLCPIQGVFLLHTQHSQDRLWMHCDYYLDNVATEDE